MLERDAELAVLRDCLARSVEGNGRLLLLEGAAGIGKSTFVGAACEAAGKAGMRVLAARGGEFERDFSFGVVRQLLEPVLAGEDREARLAGPTAAAAWIVDPPAADVDKTFAVLDGLHRLVAGLAEEAPLLVVVDDAHWADAPSVRFLDFLARRIARLPLTLLVTRRRAEPGAPAALLEALSDQPGATILALAPLSPAAVATLVRTERPGADDALVSALHRASGGNPLYVRELLRAGAGTEDEVERASAPGLAERLARRIGRVDPAAPELTAAMAILADGASLQLAAALADLELAAAAPIAQRLRQIEVLASDDPFAFAHPVLRRAVHDAIVPARRAALHARAARLLAADGAPSEQIAEHLSALPASGSAAVAGRLLDIAREAAARGAPDIAVARLRRALAEGAAEPPRALLLLELGRAQATLGDVEAVETLRAARELAGAASLELAATSALVDVLAMHGRWTAAVDVIRQTKAEHDGDPLALADLEALLAGIMANDPELVGEFNSTYDQFAAIARGSSWGARALAALLGAVAAYQDAGRARSLGWAEHALADGVLVAERGGGGWAAALVLDSLTVLDEHERALTAAAEVEAAARASGSTVGLITGAGYRVAVAIRRGDVAAAGVDLRELVDLCEQSGMQIWLTTAVLMFLDALIERTGFEDLVALTEGIEIDPGFAATASGAELAEAQGRLALARGDRATAAARLRQAEAVYRPLGYASSRTPWMSALALAIAPERPGEARSLADEELTTARSSGLARPVGIALRTAGQVDWIEAGSGRVPADVARSLRDQGTERLRASVDRLESSDARLELGRSLVELGAAHRRLHERATARRYLSAGLDLARACGADRLTRRAAEELRSAGVTPRDASALTVAEERIARRAAAGRTNVEIARELYLSRKTVETHLSHAYVKLGLSGRGSRAQLRTRLEDHAA